MSGRIIPFRRLAARSGSGEASEFTEIGRVRDRTEALVIRALLEAHGIQVLVRTRLAQSVHPFTVGDQGEVQLLVPRVSLADARRLLEGSAAPPAEP